MSGRRVGPARRESAPRIDPAARTSATVPRGGRSSGRVDGVGTGRPGRSRSSTSSSRPRMDGEDHPRGLRLELPAAWRLPTTSWIASYAGAFGRQGFVVATTKSESFHPFLPRRTAAGDLDGSLLFSQAARTPSILRPAGDRGAIVPSRVDLVATGPFSLYGGVC